MQYLPEQHLPLRSFINLPVRLTVVILMPFKGENLCCITLNIYSKIGLAGLNGADSQVNRVKSWFYCIYSNWYWVLCIIVNHIQIFLIQPCWRSLINAARLQTCSQTKNKISHMWETSITNVKIKNRFACMVNSHHFAKLWTLIPILSSSVVPVICLSLLYMY